MQTYNVEDSEIYNDSLLVEEVWKRLTGSVKKERRDREERDEKGEEGKERADSKEKKESKGEKKEDMKEEKKEKEDKKEKDDDKEEKKEKEKKREKESKERDDEESRESVASTSRASRHRSISEEKVGSSHSLTSTQPSSLKAIHTPGDQSPPSSFPLSRSREFSHFLNHF